MCVTSALLGGNFWTKADTAVPTQPYLSLLPFYASLWLHVKIHNKRSASVMFYVQRVTHCCGCYCLVSTLIRQAGMAFFLLSLLTLTQSYFMS